MDNNNDSEVPIVKKRKTNTHNSTTFKTDGNNRLGIDSLDSDIVIRFASYLCPRDLVSLSLTCRRFGGGSDADSGLSLIEDTARQIICNAEKEERDALPRMADQSYIEVYNELLKHREPRVFDQLVGPNLSYVNDDKSHVKLVGESNVNTAICNHVMRAGKHYVTFTIGGFRANVQVGLIRPVKDFDKRNYKSFGLLTPSYFGKLENERTERWGDSCVYICVLRLISGNCALGGRRWFFHDETWDGQESFRVGDDIGMLLDLDAGTLAVYKNGRRLGVMRDELSGDYCWVSSMRRTGTTVRMEKGPVSTD